VDSGRFRAWHSGLWDKTVFSYKCTEERSLADEHSLLWNDAALGIQWPLSDPVVSVKDASAPRLAELPEAALYRVPISASREAHGHSRTMNYIARSKRLRGRTARRC
jgi:hypothetical protein